MNRNVSTLWLSSTVEHGGRVLYISTDYVFDGAAPPYKTDDEPNPVNIYGQLKLEGEESVLKVNKGKLNYSL